MSNGPERTFHSAASLGLQLAAWRNDKGNLSFSLSKRYKDKESGEWKDTKYLQGSDLGGLLELANRALVYAAAQYDLRRAQKEDPQPAAPKRVASGAPSPKAGFDDDDIPF